MELTTFVQTIANSVVAGSIYATVAVGLALAFGVMQMANHAHGEFFMLGATNGGESNGIAYFEVVCRQSNLPYGRGCGTGGDAQAGGG